MHHGLNATMGTSLINTSVPAVANAPATLFCLQQVFKVLKPPVDMLKPVVRTPVITSTAGAATLVCTHKANQYAPTNV
jgi:hypothetical protein